MSTAIDTNIIVALWDRNDSLNVKAMTALDAALRSGSLVVCAPVYAELLAFPGRNESFLDRFCRETSIAVEWELGEPVWRMAGRAFQAYTRRRKKQPAGGPRRILADFLIGAHAFHNGYRLLTLDDGLYRAAFSRLNITTI